jgi:hypothetical protein
VITYENQMWLKRHKRFSLRMRLFEGIRRSRALSMSDPRTGGVTQAPRKMKEDGVKNLLQATATPDFQKGYNNPGYSRVEVAADARRRV